MGDPRAIIERAAERVTPRRDAFERLERRRERKARNRRISAGVVALVVALGGSYAAFTAFRGASSSVAGGSSGFHALWPEQTLGAAEQAQTAVDGGQDPWRTDPEEVATRFVTGVLGWIGFQTEVVPGSGTAYVFSTPPPPCPSPVPVPTTAGTTCPSLENAARQLTVTLGQLVTTGPNGIWSVVTVSSVFEGDAIGLQLDPGQDVASGTELTLPFRWPFGAEGDAGSTYLADCGPVAGSSGVVPRQDSVTFTVADLSIGDACSGGPAASTGSSGGIVVPPFHGGELDVPVDGYVFLVMTANQVPAQDPLEDPYLGDDLGKTPLAFAAVPVHFVPATSGPPVQTLPNVAKVTCDGQDTKVSTAVVQPQPDGVHIEVDNTANENLGVEVKDVGAKNARPGSSDTIWDIGPGRYQVACSSPASDNLVPLYQPLEVQDPEHLWTSTDLDCSSATGSASAFSPGAVGEKGSPVEIVQAHVTGLQTNDTIGAAGYTESSEPQVRIVRGGNVIATYHFISDGQGGWLLDQSQMCTDANLGWSGTGPTGSTGPTASPGSSGSTGAGTASGTAIACQANDGANGGPTGAELHLTNQNLTFDTNCLNAPAGKAFTILFDNLDPGTPKNVSIYPMTDCLRTAVMEQAPPNCAKDLNSPVFRGEIIDGTQNSVEIVYQVDPLDAGTYYFQDDVHPMSNGVLIVGTSTSDLYPRGAFTWCPSPPFPEPPNDWRTSASDLANKFVDLYRSGDSAAWSGLLDTSVPAGASWPIPTSGPRPTVIATSAAGGDLVRFGCGPDVDAYTTSVAFDDGTNSASLDFTLYLVFRIGGWKVWGAY